MKAQEVLSKLFKIKGIDLDINRKEYANIENMKMLDGKYPEELSNIPKHNTLFDAMIIKRCYLKAIW